MELEDYVEKLQKQKKAEKKQRRKQEKDERVENRDQRKRLMKFTSSQKYRMSEVGKRHMWKVFKERRKNYYNYPRGVVYLSCIPHGFFEEQMASYFNQFGKVTGIYMPRAPSGKIRGYAFIEFQLEVIAKIVADTMNNYLFYQRILKAKYIPPDQQKPYMFVFPFSEKRKTAVRIAAEQKRRDVQLTEAQEETYKQRMANKMEKKMAALGTDYCVQVSGEAPTPPALTNKQEKRATKKKLKEIKAALSVKTDNEDQKDSESLLDEKLAKQIKKQISAKLSKPLKKKTAKKSKVQEKESDSDQDSESEADFETADEGSFFNDDDFAIGDSDSDNEEFADFDSDDDDAVESPVKKMKVETSTSHQKKGKPDKSPAQKKASVNKSPGNKNAKAADKSPITKKAQVGKSPAQKKEKIDKTPSKPTKVAEKSPTNKKAKLEESPITKKAKGDKTPKKTEGTKNEPSLVESAKKTPAKTPSKTSESVVSKTPKSVGKEGKSKKSEKLRTTSPKKNEKVVTSPAEGLKRKSMSDVKMKKGLLNVEKKRKSLPK